MEITLQQFHKAVKRVAKEKGIDYISVKVEMDQNSDIQLHGYIHGSNWETGLTIKEVCDKLRRKKSPIKKVKIDIPVTKSN